jgi:hypothetical protein
MNFDKLLFAKLRILGEFSLKCSALIMAVCMILETIVFMIKMK